VSAQVQVDNLRLSRQAGKVGLEVGVVVALGPAVQQHHGGPLRHLRAAGHGRGTVNIEPQPGPVHLDVHATLFSFLSDAVKRASETCLPEMLRGLGWWALT
jgi:hypothetical protein